VFTGGIGEHDSATRAQVLTGTEVLLESSMNESKASGVRLISASNSKTTVFVVPSQEDLVIALHVKLIIGADT
jgi:acetate kinase